jgi:hypothetical protein
MSRPTTIAALLTASLLASCVFSRGAVHSYRTERGRPLAEDGAAEAYLVWNDGDGWHLRARSDVARRFHGRVETGKLENVTAAGVPDGAVRAEGKAIAFSFVASGPGEAGFDWTGKDCAELSIYVDGEARPLRIFAGEYGASPPRVPFTLCR